MGRRHTIITAELMTMPGSVPIAEPMRMAAFMPINSIVADVMATMPNFTIPLTSPTMSMAVAAAQA